MKRNPPYSLQHVVVLTSRATAMSSRPPFRGGRNQSKRGYSSRPFSGGDRAHYVTGDSHIRSVQDANLGFRQGNAGSFNNQTGHHHRPPPQSNHFRGPPPSHHNQPYRPHNQFRPPQQSRQRSQKPLDYRNWEYAKTTPPPNSEKFIVLSYNILADYLAIGHRSKLYYHIPRHMMDWQWRKKNLVFELNLWSADIMCFQEVDRFQELQDELGFRGYNGIWKMRTGNPVDGCAVFWRSSRFKLLHEECIEFNKLGLRDNVAQICVLESLRQTSKENNAALPTSSSDSNRVVICNIHVLYNPGRGEIKLGQVRLLLDKAHAVSKFWNDAPIVLCGDFNCTPKSPLYNLISEQKLDVSEVDRDKVSGQASAEIGPPRSFNPNYRGQHANNSVQGSPRAELMEADINVNNLTSDPNNLNNPESNVEDAQLVNIVSQPQLSSALDNQSFIDVHREKDNCGHDAQANLESKQNDVDVCKVETGSAFHVQGDELEENPSNGDVSVNLSDETHKYFTAVSKNSEKDVTDIGYDFPCEEISLVDRSSQHEVSITSASTNLDPEGQTKLENMSLTEPEFDEAIPEGGNIAENDTAFLSALHNTGDGFASDFASVPPNDMSTASTDRIEEELSPGLDSEIVGVKRSTYDPSQWTPMEIETATGNGECTLLEHPLKLKSTYTEVEDCSGTRDPNGEPLVTSYNRCFFGTVDYIWRSEGLQTVRVLAPIPKHAMQWTSGFPTRKWGSDHIALATELVFMKCSDRSAV